MSDVSRLVVCVTAFFFLAGNVYYSIDDYAYFKTREAIIGVGSFEGKVIDEPRRRAGDQVLEVKITEVGELKKDEVGANVLVYASAYPELFYGDTVKIVGQIDAPPQNSYGRFLAKERVHGTVFYPKIEILGNEGNFLLDKLYDIKRSAKEVLHRLFTAQQATFLIGILLGDREEFSPEFLEKLGASGTLHLTALSGSNMIIIVVVASSLFGFLFSGRRKVVFGATFLLVASFVTMTGFQVSAVRAALMAFVVGLAGGTGGIYNPRNALMFAAVLITVFNPKTPVFDLGFQLSFVATIAIVYFAPVLMRLPWVGSGGFLNWRDGLRITIAAQVGVAPIAIAAFSNFSFSALPANIALLAVMPLLMVLGFIVIFIGYVFPPLAFLFSKPTAFLLDYSEFIVDIFYTMQIPFNPSIGIAGVLLYYVVLIWLCARLSPATKNFF